MTSSINTSLPIQGRPTTASVRANFAYAKSEIEALQTKTTGQINVKEYGAVGDGATDDTTAIQAAIDATEAAGGGQIFFPEGTYKISDTLTVGSYIEFVGSGKYTSVISALASLAITTPAIQNVTVSGDGSRVDTGIAFRHIGFDGAARTSPAWLSNPTTGAAITDPEADYETGGSLMVGVTQATATATAAGGVVTTITLVDGGSGYVNAPVVQISGGGGVGATATATLTGDAVSGFTITNAGAGYTSDPTVTLAGGNGGPTELIAADRRNPNYADGETFIDLRKCVDVVFFDCRFYGHTGYANIADRGCENTRVSHCLFESGGQVDYVGSAVWAQSYGTPGGGQAFYAATKGFQFVNNTVRNWNRSALTIGAPEGALVQGNTFDGWKESCIYAVGYGDELKIIGNRFISGRLSDIVCAAVENAGASCVISNNYFYDIDGPAIATNSGNVTISDNVFVDCPSFTTTELPHGPYSERYGFGVGTTIVAGTSRPGLEGIIIVQDADSDPANAPVGVIIQGNHFIDSRAAGADKIIMFAKGAADAIDSVLIKDNNISHAAANSSLFKATNADPCLVNDSMFRVVDNVGHASSGAVAIQETIASGTTGSYAFTFDFRPRVVLLWAKAISNSYVSVWTGCVVDQPSRNPGTTGSSNTAANGLRAVINSGATVIGQDMESNPIKVLDNSGAIVFSASPVGFSATAWSFSINTNTADTEWLVVGIP